MPIQQNSCSKMKSPCLAIVTALSLYSASTFAQQCQTLVWEDDFNQASIDTSAWEVQTGDGCDQGAGMCGWGNSELQSYQSDNITLANGILTIEARKQRIKSTQYTSGRIRTANMPSSGEWAFGRFEARMKFPDGQGMWPAFWMLPTDPAQGWPMSGEIDIFESVGQSANMSYGTIHYGQPWPDNSHTGGSMLMQPGKWSDDFHTYAIEWQANEIRWYVDNMLYSVKTIDDVTPEDWPFDGRNNFHFILNLAVGGTWGGTVDNAALPQKLQVDYIRVFGGAQPNLIGNHLPAPGSTQTYTLDNSNGNTVWTVTGGTVTGTGDSVDITWNATSANTTQTLSATSGGCDVTTQIYVGKNLTTETVLEDYDTTSNMSVTFFNGTYIVENGVLTYTRDAASQWDVIAASTSVITDANSLIIGDKAFQLDINNTLPSLIGKEMIIQLENSAIATPENYPSGRHSKYNAYIENANGWQTLRFNLIERIDGSTADNAVDSILLLLDPNNFTNDTYILDNIEILGEANSTPVNNPPTASINLNCSDLSCDFDGSGSADSDGSIVSYVWDFGDGNTASTSLTTHSYAQEGTYTVSLTVVDDDGASDSATIQITVSNAPAGNPTSTVVDSVVTATQSAGRGNKYGTAAVVILDDLGNPVEGVTVHGHFSGTWNEAASAATDANGIANLITATSASGGVTINFCVSDITGRLPFDSAASTNVCP